MWLVEEASSEIKERDQQLRGKTTIAQNPGVGREEGFPYVAARFLILEKPLQYVTRYLLPQMVGGLPGMESCPVEEQFYLSGGKA